MEDVETDYLDVPAPPGLVALLAAMWQRKVLVGLSMLPFLVLALLWLWLSPSKYVASAMIYPSSDVSDLGQNTGSMGLSLFSSASKNPPTPFEKFLAVMRTPDFAAEMDRRLDLAKRLFPQYWDGADKRWVPPRGMHAAIYHLLGWKVYPFDPVRGLTEFFGAALAVEQPNKDSTLTTISFGAADRALAQDVLATALDTARQILIDEKEVELSKEIGYLERQLETVQLMEHRVELSKLLAGDEREMMLIKAGSYGAAVLQPAYTPPEPVRPNIRVTLVIALGLGLLVGLGAALMLALRDLPAEY